MSDIETRTQVKDMLEHAERIGEPWQTTIELAAVYVDTYPIKPPLFKFYRAYGRVAGTLELLRKQNEVERGFFCLDVDADPELYNSWLGPFEGELTRAVPLGEFIIKFSLTNNSGITDLVNPVPGTNVPIPK